MNHGSDDIGVRIDEAEGWLDPVLPQPVRPMTTNGGMVLVCGEPAAVVVRLNGAAIRIGVFAAMQWRDLTALADEPIASILWKHLPNNDEDALAAIGHIVKAAETIHASRLRARASTEPSP